MEFLRKAAAYAVSVLAAVFTSVDTDDNGLIANASTGDVARYESPFSRKVDVPRIQHNTVTEESNRTESAQIYFVSFDNHRAQATLTHALGVPEVATQESELVKMLLEGEYNVKSDASTLRPWYTPPKP